MKSSLSLADKIALGVATLNDFEGYEPQEVFETKATLPFQVRGLATPKLAKAFNEQERTADFLTSVERTDRMGDILRLGKTPKNKGGGEGVLLDNFEAAGSPVLWSHNPRDLPIGSVIATSFPRRKIEGQSTRVMRQRFQYLSEDENPFAEAVFQLVLAGRIRATSVGFLPIKTMFPENDEEREELGLGRFGIVVLTWELLEDSNVMIPANPWAVVDSKGMIEAHVVKGLDELVERGKLSKSLRELFERECPLGPEDALMRSREKVRSFVDLAQDERELEEELDLDSLYKDGELVELDEWLEARQNDEEIEADENVDEPEGKGKTDDEDKPGGEKSHKPKKPKRDADAEDAEDDEDLETEVFLVERSPGDAMFHVEHDEDGEVRVALSFQAEDAGLAAAALSRAPDALLSAVRRTIVPRGISAEDDVETLTLEVSPDLRRDLERGFETLSDATELVGRLLDLLDGTDSEEEEAGQERSADPRLLERIDELTRSVSELKGQVEGRDAGDGGDGEPSRSDADTPSADSGRALDPLELAEFQEEVRSL